MCSISGLLRITKLGGGLTEEAVARMNAAQRHRGPDDQGTWSRAFGAGEVSLGNTRLAIIDTSSTGHQPMLDPETGNCITYNGETYNFKQLSADIRLHPRSKTDTEVVLRCYAERGPACFDQIRGMFALAIWDENKRELVLARDRFGIKPLYYSVSDQLFIFASELRALLATGLIPRKLSRSGLDSYLATGSVTAPLTMVEGVRQLLPGHYLRVKASDSGSLKCTVAKFVSDNREFERPETRDEAVAQVRAELEESVRAHLVSDVPLGVFLSGGMDSSALVGLMSQVSAQPPKTFSVVFDEAELSEEQYSRSVARSFNTDHCEIRLGEAQLLEMLPDAIAALDQPSMDGVNTFVVSRAVKNAGVTVALSGLGGDELFAGYPSFRRALKLASMPVGSRRVLRAAAAAVGGSFGRGSVRREKFWQLASSGGSAAEVYQITRQLFPTSFRPQMNTDKDRSDADVVNAISRLEIEGYMANTLLRDTDAMSMAHSLEVRVPFVDAKVVDLVLSLPFEWKLKRERVGGQTQAPKPLLADAVADLLPRDFLARRKMGFTLPFEKWMQGRLRSEISSVFQDSKQLAAAGLVAEDASELWQRFLRAPRAVGWTRPWSLFVLAQWCQVNRVSL
jgi:asparagine synthase (glutamine-hydrolysing)